MKKYDVIVIGGGPGGYVAAARAAQGGLKTALVEKDQMGGTCVNWGCIPTKALLKNSEVIQTLSAGKTFGFTTQGAVADYGKGYKRSRQVAKRQGKRVEALLKNRGVETIAGEGFLISRNEVEIRQTGERILGKNIILATGSTPRQIPGVHCDGEKIITSREALDLAEVPESVIIVGAGPIGMEFATIWNNYGSQVTVLEMQENILPLEDGDVAKEAELHFKKAGINIKTAVKVESIEKTEEGVEVTVSSEKGKEVLQGEKVLISIGVTPNTKDLGLENIGIKTNRGYIDIDEKMATNIPGIYAVGDVTGKLALAHVASAQGMIAADKIIGLETSKLVYSNIPRCVFGHIEVASVGLTEKQAQEKGYELMTIISPFVPNGKALALNENWGFIKLIGDKKSRQLLGAHMVGPQVTELIAGPTAMIALGATVEQLAQVVYPHPTLSEGIMEGIHGLAGHAIHL